MRRRALALLLVSSVYLPACGSSGSGDKGGAAPKGGPVAPELKRRLDLLPPSDAVVGVELGKARGSALYKGFETRIRGAATSALGDVEQLCGFNPADKVESVVVGGGGEQLADLTLIVTGPGKAETMGCLEKARAQLPAGWTVDIAGDFVTIAQGAAPAEAAPSADTRPDAPAADPAAAPAADPAAAPAADPAAAPAAGPTQSVAMQFLDDRTVVLARRGGKAPDAAAMKALLAGTGGLTSSAEFMKILNGMDTTAPLWFLVNGQASMVTDSQLGGFLKFNALFGSVAMTDGLALDATIRVASVDEANQMSAMANRLLSSVTKSPELKDKVGTISVVATGPDVRLRLMQTRQQLEALIAYATESIGGMFK